MSFLAQILHRFPALAKYDGMRFSFLAQILHRFSALAKYDGMRFKLPGTNSPSLSGIG